MPTNTNKKISEKKAKPISQKYLENAALYYMSRYATSKHNLRTILVRKVDRRVRQGAARPDDVDSWIDEIATRFEKLGLINDKQFAEGSARGLLQKGKPPRMVEQELRRKGIEDSIVEATLERMGNPKLLEYQAAAKFVRKKRIGPFENTRLISRKIRYTEDKLFEKNMMMMARSGFAPDVARKILQAKSEEEIDTILTTIETAYD